MKRLRAIALVAAIFVPAAVVSADPPTVAYIYPAGGRCGTTVDVRVGALDLSKKASFEILGRGVSARQEIRRTDTIWLEGPVLQQPESVVVEDYPKDYAGRIEIANDAPTGPRAWRVWNSEGASGSLPFIVGDLPEVIEIEREEDGTAVAVPVTLPVTANGRIFPREDLDLWSFQAKAGEVVNARADVARLGSALEARLEALGPRGQPITEVMRSGNGDPGLSFIAPESGTYTIKIHDVGSMGSQRHLYRLNLTSGPRIAWLYPLGGLSGSSVPFLAGGPGVSEMPRTMTLPSMGTGLLPRQSALHFEGVGSAMVEIDGLPEVLEVEPNDSPTPTAIVPVPGVANGCIGRKSDVDVWAIAMTSGHTYTLDLRASRLGSRLDPVLSVTDREGKNLGSSDGIFEAEGDPELTVRPQTTGLAYVRIRDRFRSRGGPAWAYRLRVKRDPSLDFSLSLESDTITLTRESTVKLTVHTRRVGGFEGPIEVVLEGLPEGVSAPRTVIDPKSSVAEIALKSDKKAPIRSARLTFRGCAELNGGTVSRVAVRRESSTLPAIDTVRLAVGLKPPFQLTGPVDFSSSPRGTIHHHPFRMTAESCVGPIEVRIADKQIRHLQGITAPVVVIPPGVRDFDFAVTLPPWMETGRTSRTVLTTEGVVREPDGTEHEVSRTWPDNVHQLATVVGPGLITLHASAAMISLGPRRAVDVPVKLTRGKGVAGSVRVELIVPWSIRGLSATPLLVAPDQVAGTMQLACGPSFECPRSARVILRATSSGPFGKDPVTAQTSLTVLAESGRN